MFICDRNYSTSLVFQTRSGGEFRDHDGSVNPAQRLTRERGVVLLFEEAKGIYCRITVTTQTAFTPRTGVIRRDNNCSGLGSNSRGEIARHP